MKVLENKNRRFEWWENRRSKTSSRVSAANKT